MKYLITGGAGFIGSNLAHTLVNKTEEVIIIDDLSSGNLDNLKDIKDKIKFIEGSITDKKLLLESFKDVDYVIHLAAIPSVPRSVDMPFESNEANVTGSLNVLIAARDAGVKRVVYSASSSRYGDNDAKIKDEKLPINPLSPYALQKVTVEYYCKQFTKLYGLETVSLVFFNVFGPKQNPDSEYSAVIPKFIKLMMAGKSPTIYGTGDISRDFTYIDNNIDAMIKACTAKNAIGETINIASGKAVSLQNLIDKINILLGTNLKPNFEEFRKGDVMHSLADVKKAKKLLDFECIVDFDAGLKKTFESLK